MAMFKQPDLNAPRYRKKKLGILNADTINEFKEKYPAYAGIDNDKLKNVIKTVNERIWNTVIENRNGVELPESLGFLFIGTCPPAKTNINYPLSNEYGKALQNRNWETDGNVAKIFYTNWASKYRFKYRELWGFEAVRQFKRTVSKTYPENWTKYIVMQSRYKISKIFAKIYAKKDS